MNHEKTIEGRTILAVPIPGGGSAANQPVFFNPVASVNRDVSVAMASAVGGETFCDSMSGVGARGIRVANEVDAVQKVTLVDMNKEALRLARRAAVLNGVLEKCEFCLGETNTVLLRDFQGKERRDQVDLDPFGSPIRHLQSAIMATSNHGVLSVTATDTAVLCGVHQRVCLRRYGAVPLNNSFHHETALRILVNVVRRIASSLDLGISPVIAHSTRHYLRAYVRIEVGITKADANLRDVGYVISCSSCGDTSSSAVPTATCQACGKKARLAGPLWLGSLVEASVLPRAVSEAKRIGAKEATRILESLRAANSFPPWSFSIAEACSSLGIASVPVRLVADDLSGKGFRTMRQPFELTGLKTTAPHSEFVDSVRNAVRRA